MRESSVALVYLYGEKILYPGDNLFIEWKSLEGEDGECNHIDLDSIVTVVAVQRK